MWAQKLLVHSVGQQVTWSNTKTRGREIYSAPLVRRTAKSRSKGYRYRVCEELGSLLQSNVLG